MNISLFKILNEVCFVKLHRDIVHHEENSRDKMSLVLVIKIYVCSNSNLEGVEGSLAQTIVEEEGAKSEVVWLNQKFSQPSPRLSVCPSYMLDRSMIMQRVGGRSLMCVRHA